MAHIYAIDRQVTDDVAVWENIAKDTSWVRDRVKAFASQSALGFCYEFDPQSGIVIRFDARDHSGSFFGLFYRGY